jgi:xanthine dehydrogenase YagS FAD-binding subunit
MRSFAYVRASTPEEAARTLGAGENRHILAGGTDILPLAKDEIVTPGTLVDISEWSGGRGTREEGESLVIGALTTLSEIADDAKVKAQYAALAEACKSAATPQLRNMGTIGGNLLQQTRCWYFRGPFDCWLKGGDKCYARHGENELHSIFATAESPCVSAHPSDPAAALLALDASIRFTTAQGEGEMTIEELFALPESSRRDFVTLPDGAVITAVVLSSAHVGSRSTYIKAMARAAWGFALAGVAVVLDGDSTISRARVALSGVAPIPVRARAVESALEGTTKDSLNFDALATLLVAEAQPLAHNRYKVSVLRGIFAEALEAVCNSSS